MALTIECSVRLDSPVEVHVHLDNAVLSQRGAARLVQQFGHVLHQLASATYLQDRGC